MEEILQPTNSVTEAHVSHRELRNRNQKNKISLHRPISQSFTASTNGNLTSPTMILMLRRNTCYFINCTNTSLFASKIDTTTSNDLQDGKRGALRVCASNTRDLLSLSLFFFLHELELFLPRRCSRPEKLIH